MTGFPFCGPGPGQPSQSSRTRTTSVSPCDFVTIYAMLMGTAILASLCFVFHRRAYLKATERVRALYYNLVPFAIHRAALLSVHTTTGLSPLIRRLPRRAQDLIHKVAMTLLKCDARLFASSIIAPRDGARQMFQGYMDMGRIVQARRGPGGPEFDASVDAAEWAAITAFIASFWLSLGSTMQSMHRNYLYASRIHGTWRGVRGSWGVRFVVDENGEWAMPEGSLLEGIWQCARDADSEVHGNNLTIALMIRYLLDMDADPDRRRAALQVSAILQPLPAFDN